MRCVGPTIKLGCRVSAALACIALSGGCEEVAEVIEPPTDATNMLGPDGGEPDGSLPDGESDAARVEDTGLDSEQEDADAAQPSLDSVMVDAGDDHSCAVVRGALYCWGGNQRGRLGVGDGRNRVSPARVGSVDTWVEVTTGADHSCARRADGSVWCFGANDFGQLGSPGVNDVLSPLAVALPSASLTVSAESAFTCALLRDGTLYCWGQNTEGMLAQGDTYPGEDQFTPQRVADIDDFIAVDVGQGHACALRAPGKLWCWGRNSGDQLGLGDSAEVQYRAPVQVGDLDAWRQVSAGQNHSCALDDAGGLFCWGENDFGNLGTGDLLGRSTPTRIDSAEYQQVSLDTFHTCAVDDAGDLWCWGRNVEGQLGLGDTVDRVVPTRVPVGGWAEVRVGRFHTCARKLNDTVWCTGENEVGQLGLGDTDRRDEFTQVPLP